MNTFFSMTAILSAIMAVGFIEDCGGHCLGNDNWPMAFVMLGITLISAFLSIYTSKETE